MTRAADVPAPTAAPAAGGRDRLTLGYTRLGQGRPMLLLPGLNATSASFGGLLTLLAASHSLIVVDHPGIGASPAVPGRLSTSLMADAAVAVLDACSVDAACVVGFSFGGMVAQEIALRHPRRVSGLVLGATSAGGAGAPIADPRRMRVILGLRRRGSPPSERFQRVCDLVFSPGFLAEQRQALQADQEQILAGLAPPGTSDLRAAVACHDTARRLWAIRAPTLILHGTSDLAVPFMNAVRLAAGIDQADLYALVGCGHAFWIERHRVSADAITAFAAITARRCPDGLAVIGGRDPARHLGTFAWRCAELVRCGWWGRAATRR